MRESNTEKLSYLPKVTELVRGRVLVIQSFRLSITPWTV